MTTLALVEAFVSVAVFLQTVEAWGAPPYSWSVLEPEVPPILRPFAKPYAALLWLRLLSAIGVLAALYFSSSVAGAVPLLRAGSGAVPLFLGLQLLTTWLIAIRWRGTFNGGSDFMTFQILAAAFVASLAAASAVAPVASGGVSGAVPPTGSWPAPLVTGALFYVAVQVLLSYFVAGVVKLRHRDWRNGRVLAQFLENSMAGGAPAAVPTTGGLTAVAGGAPSQTARPVLSWLVIVFELSAPLCLLSRAFALFYLSAAFVFHLANFYLFGLNRFVFAWAAGYPAVLFAAGHL